MDLYSQDFGQNGYATLDIKYYGLEEKLKIIQTKKKLKRTNHAKNSMHRHTQTQRTNGTKNLEKPKYPKPIRTMDLEECVFCLLLFLS